MFKKGLILAGGEGQRMRPITKYIPKALVHYNSQPLIYYGINFLKKSGVGDIIVTYNYKSDLLFYKLKEDVNVFVNTVNQDNSYFLFNSIVKEINEPIIIIPCDIVIDIDMNKLYNDYLELGSPAILIVGTKPKEGINGDFIRNNENNVITHLDRNESSDLYSSGLQIINPQKVNDLCAPSNNFYNVWSQLLNTNNLKISNIHPNEWMCFDNIKQIIK